MRPDSDAVYTVRVMNALENNLAIACESCGAEMDIEPLMRTARCPYCDSPAVVDRPRTEDRPDPVFAIGFTVDRTRAEGAIRKRIGGKWLAPRAFKRAHVEHLQGVYMPAYLWSAASDSIYSAVVGEVYYASKFDLRKKRTRRERKIEFHEFKGEHASYVADVVVSASRGLPNAEIEAIEPFDLEGLRRYSPALVSGWISEEPSLTVEECRRLARSEAESKLEGELRGFMPGDTLQKLKFHTRFRSESLDLVLLPVWVFALRYHPSRPPVRYLVNGQTGDVHGKAPVSWAKIAAVAAAVVGLIGLIALIGSLL